MTWILGLPHSLPYTSRSSLLIDSATWLEFQDAREVALPVAEGRRELVMSTFIYLSISRLLIGIHAV